MSELKVSVITVVYNGAKTIEQTIKSVLQQNYSNIEYIIIDGNSEDGTQKIIERYQKEIAYWSSEPDRGIFDAMNKGIERASGDVIGIINSDDWYREGTIKKIVEAFCRTKADVVYGEIGYVNEKGELISCSENSMMPPHPGMFVKKSIYKKYGSFDIKYKIAADYEFKLRLYAKKIHMAYVNDLLAYFRTTGISNTKSLECLKEAYEIEMQYIKDYPNSILQKNAVELSYKKKYFKYYVNHCPERVYCCLQKKWNLSSQGILIWGTGVWGRKLLPIFANAGVPLWFTDNNKEKWGETVENIPVVSTEACKTFDGIIIVAVLNSQKEISEQIRNEFRSDAKIITLDEIQEEVLRKNL